MLCLSLFLNMEGAMFSFFDETFSYESGDFPDNAGCL